MASGTIKTTFNTGFTLKTEWSQAPIIANNESEVTCDHYLVCAKSYALYIGGRSNTCAVGGVSKSFSSAAISTSGGTTIKLGTTKHTIKHNADGTASVTLKTVFNIKATIDGAYKESVTASGTIKLDTIPRASTPSVSGTLELGQTITINTNRASDSFIHNLYYSWGTLTNQRFAIGIGASTTWEIPKDLANSIPNGTTGTLFLICETYNQTDDGTTLIGTKTISMTVSVPDTDEFKPSISNINIWENSGSGVPQDWGIYVQNQSKLSYEVTAAGAYSSTIKTYKVIVNGATYNANTSTTDVLKLAGTNSIVVEITDSRGRPATLSKEFEVVAYEGPTITTFAVNRCLEDGTLDDEGEFAKIEIAAIIPSLNNKNSYSYDFQYRDTDEDEYTQYAIELVEAKTETEIALSGSFIMEADGNNQFDYLISITDTFIPRNKIRTLETVFQLINFNASGRGMAVGKVSEKDALEIAMDMYDKFGQLINTGVAEYGDGTIDANTTLSSLCLAQYNTPNNSFYFVMTLFYGTKSAETNRTQIAIPYIFDINTDKKNMFIRQNVGGTWNEWTQI